MLRFRCRADRKLDLIRVEVLTNEYNETREGLQVFEAVCIRVINIEFNLHKEENKGMESNKQ